MTERAQLGIDGNCGFALLGEDLQCGEAEFVEIDYDYKWEEKTIRRTDAELTAVKKALMKLRKRLGRDDLNFYFGPSHPYGR